MKLAFTGGSGLLGTKIKEHFPDALYPTRSEFNINITRDYHRFFSKGFDTLVHMAAVTDTVGCENKEASNAIETNIIATANLVNECMKHGIKFIYISTDYVFDGKQGNYHEHSHLKPFNKYGWSKLGGECAVHMYDNSLIIRTSFCEDEFPYDRAFYDQYTSRTGVSECAKMIAEVIKEERKGVVHVGGERQTVLELAKQLSPEKDIQPMTIDEIISLKGYPLPRDTSLSSNHVPKFKWGS